MYEQREDDILIIGFYNCLLTRLEVYLFLGICFPKPTVFSTGLVVVVCFVRRNWIILKKNWI